MQREKTPPVYIQAFNMKDLAEVEGITRSATDKRRDRYAVVYIRSGKRYVKGYLDRNTSELLRTMKETESINRSRPLKCVSFHNPTEI